MVIETIFYSIFNPLLSYPDWLSILIFATLIIVVTNLIYKFSMDQKKVVEIKGKLKELQKKSKEASSNEEKMEYMNKMTKVNSSYMKMTMKPMLITLLVISLFLPWINANYGDKIGIVNGTSGWVMMGTNNITFSVISNGIKMNNETVLFGDKIKIGNKRFIVLKKGDNKIKFSRVIIESPVSIPPTGKDWGWLFYYFLISIPLSIVLRKLMGVKM